MNFFRFRPQILKYHDYSIGRSTPLWTVSDAAKNALRKSRLMELSKPRPMHPEYQPPKPAIPVITKAAKEASPSERLDELAKASKRIINMENEWRVKMSALNYKPSERILELSRPRPFANGYLPCKTPDETWRVSPNARKASTSDRVDELSRPQVRTVGTNLPRTDAFVVSDAAKKAKASDRIVELSQPVVRGH
ncbi:testicular haploid expressed gene protein-like [Dendronephthya gigantea]|uniref:testicular haploid expressed gene protein-like n=1 Tax=Dendronephthya gigantea TaxID=151771 RepID=UPI00106D2233|nr:testicular haploid expressed gene protein-like [Dendronephthya gigantea]